MKKTELIKNALEKAVRVEFVDGLINWGWLVRSEENCKEYKLLPFDKYQQIFVFKVSHVKHIWFDMSDYKLW